MNTNAVTAQNCSLFEIDAELEAAFDQMQEERDRQHQRRESRTVRAVVSPNSARRSIASRHTCEHNSATTMTDSFGEYWTSPNWIWNSRSEHSRIQDATSETHVHSIDSFCSSFTINFERSSITFLAELGLNVSLTAVQRSCPSPDVTEYTFVSTRTVVSSRR